MVLDPFNGIGSTGYVALRNGRSYTGIELKESYYHAALANLKAAASYQANALPLFAAVSE
jgi:DNA modification methylase